MIVSQDGWAIPSPFHTHLIRITMNLANPPDLMECLAYSDHTDSPSIPSITRTTYKVQEVSDFRVEDSVSDHFFLFVQHDTIAGCQNI